MPNEKTADYGPLELLFGTWKGDKGIDFAPEPDEDATSDYYETITFERAGDVDNADEQVLAIARYHISVRRKKNDETFHDQVGYWLWDKENKTIMNSLTIPRGLCVLAGGMFDFKKGKNSQVTFNVAAKLDEEWGITQSPFMRDNAKTLEFSQKLTVSNEVLSYSQTTVLDIYGRIFNHTDENTLKKV
ncbi:MAG: heme-binding beta-barrel domain-containing protein [Bacteroidota bacterium]